MSSEFNFPTNAFGYVPGTIPAKIIYADSAPTNPVEALFWMNTAPGELQGTLSIRTSIVDSIPTWVTLNSEGLLRAQLELLTSVVPVAGVPAKETSQMGFFADGIVLQRKNHIVIAEDGQAWFWRGSFPKTVLANSTPESSGGIGIDKWQKVITAFDSGNFQTGFVATTLNQFFVWPTSAGGDGKRYIWKGAYPKTVPANSSPLSTGGISDTSWESIEYLEDLLAGNDGSKMIGYQADLGFPKRNIYLKLTATKSIKDYALDEIGTGSLVPLSSWFSTLEEAQQYYPKATSLTDSVDWAVLQTVADYLVGQGKPAFLECDAGQYVFNRGLILNGSLNCATPVIDINFIGEHGHRAYDSGTEMPCSFSAVGTFDALFDLRASRQISVQGIGFYSPNTINRIMRIGSEGCSNISQMFRVLTLEHCLFYGGQRNLDAYLVSGLLAKTNNFSRASARGLNLNSVGDSEFTENLVNNCGPILTGGVGSNYYDGAGVMVYGGGGSNRWSGGKLEVCSKGMLLDNVHSWGVHEVTFDKCKEFALAVSGNQNTAGKTANLGYQPRNIRITGNNFLSNGWDSVYRSHLWFANSGNDLELSATLVGNTFAKGGQNAIPLDMEASGIFGAGPYRCIRGNNSGLGTSTLRISSSGNKYNDGATNVTFESYSNNVRFASDESDEMNLPVITQNGAEQFGTRVTRRIPFDWTPGIVEPNTTRRFTFYWDPGTVLSGETAISPITSVSGLTFNTPIEIAAPASLQGLFLQAYTTSSGNFVARAFNPTGGSIVGPAGLYTIEFSVTNSVQSSVITLSGLGFDSSISVSAPSSLLGLQLNAYPVANGSAVLRLDNPTNSPITGPSGTFYLEYTLLKWVVDEFPI